MFDKEHQKSHENQTSKTRNIEIFKTDREQEYTQPPTTPFTADRVLIHTKMQSADETEPTNRPADSSCAAI